MRRSFAGIAVSLVALLVLYLMLKVAGRSPETATEVDTMCLASRIGLPCAS